MCDNRVCRNSFLDMESPAEVPNDESFPTEDSESFLRNGADIRISNQDGFLCKVRMKALIDLRPDEVRNALPSIRETTTTAYRSMHRVDSRLTRRGTSHSRWFCLQMYQLLTHPDNSAIFKSIDKVSERRVGLATPEKREVYIEQTSTVGVLFFKRQFTTALNVTETPKELTASFDLAKPGMMSAFQVYI